METIDNHSEEYTILLNALLKNFEMLTALRAENNMLWDIIQESPGNMYWTDLQGKLLGCNKNMYQIVGLSSPKDLIGKTTRQLVGKGYAESVEKNNADVISSGKEITYEETGLDSNHNPATYLSKKLPLYNSSGEITGTLGISFDITHIKQKEKELQAEKEKAEKATKLKSQFVASVNHELRTPLAAVMGLINLVEKKGLKKEEKAKAITSIKSSINHLLDLVNDVLDLSKLESGKPQAVQLVPVNFSTILTEVHDLLRSLAKQKNLTFTQTVDSHLPPLLLADPRMVRHILTNLVGNAIKYTPQGGVTLQLDVLKQTDKRAQLKISIIDTGPGIPEDKIEIIFKPFEQLDNPNARQFKEKSTGLGLAIVKNLVKAIDAKLEVTSEVGKGSTFALIADFPIPTAAQMPLPPPPKKKRTGPIRALLVEDDPVIQFIQEKLLLDLKCKVDVVSTADEAMKVLNARHHIIFLDMSLPGMNGLELIKMIRAETPFDCPIVMISAYIDKKEEMDCIKAGASECIYKPVSEAKLQELLGRYC